jgi:hypothetical protein
MLIVVGSTDEGSTYNNAVGSKRKFNEKYGANMEQTIERQSKIKVKDGKSVFYNYYMVFQE